MIGAYALAKGAGSLTVAMGARGLGIQRDGSIERTHIHLGGRVFHPAGANAVRIRLQGSADRAASLTVEDGPLIVTATRVG